MKRFFCMVCIFVIVLTMAACDPGTYRLREEAKGEAVVSVELIQYENPNQKKFGSWVPDHSEQLREMELTAVTVLETLDDANKERFLNQLSMEELLWKYYVFDSPKGICIRITYSSGDFLIISNDYENRSYCGYIGMYSEDGEVTEFYGTFISYSSFESLVNDYFETKV